ncbi:MAG: DUF4336 domain-containing protein [Paraburkholderia sp.]|uniref:DUF4336 domain-containing protein n=1 Tax=Paraburkholderia sp. TaxID=1926495 RepID=UPI003C4DC8D3
MSHLERLAENIWTVATPHSFLAMHLGTRMTVVRLANGGLWLHSPVAMSAAVRAELDALGPISHIVCPNLYHHVYAGDAQAAYPQAMLHGPQALRLKRKDLRLDADLSETPHADWSGELVPLSIHGCMLAETVFFHVPSRSLITSDLVENFTSSPHWPTRMYLKACGLEGKITWGRPYRLLYRDRKAARASMDRLLQWPFERVVVAHGDLILNDAHDSIERGMAWLKA